MKLSEAVAINKVQHDIGFDEKERCLYFVYNLFNVTARFM
jgi:hypothetical protein